MILSISCFIVDNSSYLMRLIIFWIVCYKVWKEIFLKFVIWDKFNFFEIIFNVSMYNVISESVVLSSMLVVFEFFRDNFYFCVGWG